MKKPAQIVIAIEEPVLEAFTALARREGISNSALGRSLIVRELMRRELLPPDMLQQLVS